MDHRSLQLAGPDGPVPADEVIPDGVVRGALIVVQEAFGVNEHIIDVCSRFAEVGYHAIAPHLYHRDGVSALPYQLDLALPHMAALTADGIRVDLGAAREHLATQGFAMSATGIVGFCMGGSIALIAASEEPFGAAVTFYGRGIVEGRFGFRPLGELAPMLRSPWLGLYGDQDPSIPVDEVEALRVAAAAAHVPTLVIRYAQAGHGFHCDARSEVYHEAAAKDAWTKTVDWFARYLA
jgi:carboxymethylenebutenolidase